METQSQPDVLSARLHEILHAKFGFQKFRPYQEEVCRAAASGQDLLLVMPTGAGKSLCYQLPGLVSGQTTLVISPLLALIEDQVGKLQSAGLRAERIHSGRDRESSREVCGRYVRGELDYLFIAPERLAVPGFIELLAKRAPGLIAVDEAHCISQWGHDFRPEYRMLGKRLAAFRPAPILALTATATPRVQTDIVEQLGIPEAKRFIHGFRRHNIAIECVELNPGERIDAVRKLLADPESRPAILYAPTRKKAEETADELKGLFKIDAYHAGMTPAARDKVQTAFLSGRLDVVVATIAFGMGIDKSNVRTVAHLALPSSVEAYYQEIGRAGRDGDMSKAVLMYAFIDRRTHEFFFDKAYPAVEILNRIFNETTDEPVASELLCANLRMDTETFEKALEKLWVHGAVQIDANQEVRRGNPEWVAGYLANREHREAQLGQMTQFTQNQSCRMLQLVKYFGDRSDNGKLCGICDSCAPEQQSVGRFRPLTADEQETALAILRGLSSMESPGTSQLHRTLFGEGGVERQNFERILAGLGRAKLVNVYEDSFTKDGKLIQFRRASLAIDGKQLIRAGVSDLSQYVLVAEEPTKKGPGSRKKATLKKAGYRKAAEAMSDGAGSRSVGDFDDAPVSPELVEALKEWRLNEARVRRVPAFMILPNRVLAGIAQARPRDTDELLAVHGIGPKLVEKYGRAIVEIVARKFVSSGSF